MVLELLHFLHAFLTLLIPDLPLSQVLLYLVLPFQPLDMSLLFLELNLLSLEIVFELTLFLLLSSDQIVDFGLLLLKFRSLLSCFSLLFLNPIVVLIDKVRLLLSLRLNLLNALTFGILFLLVRINNSSTLLVTSNKWF